MRMLEQVTLFVTNGTPTYMEAVLGIKNGFVDYLKPSATSTSYGPVDFFTTLARVAKFENVDIAYVFGLAILWTLARYAMNAFILLPLARWLKLSKTNSWKFPESAWKLIVYTCTWSYSTYVIFGLERYNHIFYEPETLWDDYSPSLVIEPIVYWMYLMQLAFYIHSIYGTFFMDVWRKDSAMMVCHHFLTIFLIGFSYLTRYHKIGLLVMWVHDVTDIVLEFTKCNVYLKTRGGVFHRFNDILSSVGFVIFTICWYLFRLYWFPLKVLYSAGYSSTVHHRTTCDLHFLFFFNVMLWLLQLLNLYWFTFIIGMIGKLLAGQAKEIDDIREDDIDQKSSSDVKNGKKNKKKMRIQKKTN